MKFLLPPLVLLTGLLATLSQAMAGVSVSIGEPGFYGRLDIGNFPPPRLIYPEPVIVRRVSTWYPPIYLRVPPGHVKQWYRYCDRYDACGRPVYFVDDSWYEEVYVPRYREYRPRVYAPPVPPPVIIRRPDYYEYRKYPSKPPKKIYIREYDHDRHHDRHDRRDERYDWKHDDRGRGRGHHH